jgi:ubiquinone/menaquinone biosynthesis C-methylase UbiE
MNERLEKLIGARFDYLADSFPSAIEESDSRLKAILQRLGSLGGKRVLEIGCGKGRISRILKRHDSWIYGIDISEKLLQDAKKICPFHFIKAEAYRVPFRDDTFDAVVLLEVIEHIPNLDNALTEMVRVLKKSGRLIIVDRNKFSLNNRRFLVPNLIIKRYHELKNEWMYPRTFPYREIWFSPSKVMQKLERYFKEAEYDYILSDGEKEKWWHLIFRFIPESRHFVLWSGIDKFSNTNELMKEYYPKATLKEFGTSGMYVYERVSDKPRILNSKQTKSNLSGIFCLRIDADEYERDSFGCYYGLFERYKDAITIFFNVNSFINATAEISKCKSIGLDIQSHGFYHYTYSDYRSNRLNIHKAKVFFETLSIATIGFAAPMGKWNVGFIKALEDEGYKYSSDFAYDYLGLPSYPYIGKRRYSILEIPIFPVAPELFLQKKVYTFNEIFSYYKKAIDEISFCGLPVIIYAHTSRVHREIPGLLIEILEYATWARKMRLKNMSEIFETWNNLHTLNQDVSLITKVPPIDFLGKKIAIPYSLMAKDFIKNLIDFERVTPNEELCCSSLRKMAKISARKLCKEKRL